MTKTNYYPKSRCCGLCDGVNDICVADTVCETHNELGCEICFGKRHTIESIFFNFVSTDNEGKMNIKYPFSNADYVLATDRHSLIYTQKENYDGEFFEKENVPKCDHLIV